MISLSEDMNDDDDDDDDDGDINNDQKNDTDTHDVPLSQSLTVCTTQKKTEKHDSL